MRRHGRARPSSCWGGLSCSPARLAQLTSDVVLAGAGEFASNPAFSADYTYRGCCRWSGRGAGSGALSLQQAAVTSARRAGCGSGRAAAACFRQFATQSGGHRSPPGGSPRASIEGPREIAHHFAATSEEFLSQNFPLFVFRFRWYDSVESLPRGAAAREQGIFQCTSKSHLFLISIRGSQC